MKFKAGDKVTVVKGIMSGTKGVVNRTAGPSYIVDFKDDSSGLTWVISMNEDEIELEALLTLPNGTQLNLDALYMGDYGYDSHVSDEQKQKWKNEGRCQECGTLLPMSIWGLGECPQHPKPGGPQ